MYRGNNTKEKKELLRKIAKKRTRDSNGRFVMELRESDYDDRKARNSFYMLVVAFLVLIIIGLLVGLK